MYNPTFIKRVVHKYIDEAKGKVVGEEFRSPCPAHADEDPSFSINTSTGLYNCFNPSCKFSGGGNIVKFAALLDDKPLGDAKKELDAQFNKDFPRVKTKAKVVLPFGEEDIQERVEALANNERMLARAAKDFMWTAENMRKMDIGWDEATCRFWIPVYKDGNLFNIKQYNPSLKIKIMGLKGAGTNALYPEDNLRDGDLYLVEGEKDCILANQLGLNAVTSTGGAGKFDPMWKPHFSNKNLVICYDNDQAGDDGAQKVTATLIHVCKTIKQVRLPNEKEDFTDYIKRGNTIQDFMQIVEKTPVISKDEADVVTIPETVLDVSLDKIDEKKLFYKRTRTNVRVIGTESAPFIVPKCMGVTCMQDNGKACGACDVGDAGGNVTVVMTETQPLILDMIECRNKEKDLIIRTVFGMPACNKFKYKETEHQSIARVSVIPAIDDVAHDEETQNQTYVERELYFIGKSLKANTDYEIETLTIPSPKDQSLVHLGYKVKFADTSIEEFKLTDEVRKQLELFECQSNQNLMKSTQT